VEDEDWSSPEAFFFIDLFSTLGNWQSTLFKRFNIAKLQTSVVLRHVLWHRPKLPVFQRRLLPPSSVESSRRVIRTRERREQGQNKQMEKKTSYSSWITVMMETVVSCDTLVRMYHLKDAIIQKTKKGINTIFRIPNIISVQFLDFK